MKVVHLLVKQLQSQVSELYNVPSSKRTKSSWGKLQVIRKCLFGPEYERFFSRKGWIVQQHTHLDNVFGRISDGNINSNSILERIKKPQNYKINYERLHVKDISQTSKVLTHCLHLCKPRLHLCLMRELTQKKPSCSKKHFRQPSSCKLFNSINMEKFKSSWLVCVLPGYFTFQDMAKACQNTPFKPVC